MSQGLVEPQSLSRPAGDISNFVDRSSDLLAQLEGLAQKEEEQRKFEGNKETTASSGSDRMSNMLKVTSPAPDVMADKDEKSKMSLTQKMRKRGSIMLQTQKKFAGYSRTCFVRKTHPTILYVGRNSHANYLHLI